MNITRKRQKPRIRYERGLWWCRLPCGAARAGNTPCSAWTAARQIGKALA